MYFKAKKKWLYWMSLDVSAYQPFIWKKSKSSSCVDTYTFNWSTTVVEMNVCTLNEEA